MPFNFFLHWISLISTKPTYYFSSIKKKKKTSDSPGPHISPHLLYFSASFHSRTHQNRLRSLSLISVFPFFLFLKAFNFKNRSYLAKVREQFNALSKALHLYSIANIFYHICFVVSSVYTCCVIFQICLKVKCMAFYLQYFFLHLFKIKAILSFKTTT